MASVQALLITEDQFYATIQKRVDIARDQSLKRFRAIKIIQKMVRGYLIRKHIAMLNRNAIIIQCAFRRHASKKVYRAALQRAVREKYASYYQKAAMRIQALWRGYISRKKIFSYYAYRNWLAVVKHKGDQKVAEALEFRERCRMDDIKTLEEEARKWIAYVVYKLHHLLRTYSKAGIYSDPATTELTEFEKLLNSIKYTEYKKRLKRKYDAYVRKHRPLFSNKRVFPVIGEGADYWYLSLPELYELTETLPKPKRYNGAHHGPIHEKPFLWRKFRTTTAEEMKILRMDSRYIENKVPAKRAVGMGQGDTKNDPRFCLYVKYYTPRPELLDYVDFHINLLLARKCEMHYQDK